ncbi:hypothetical protein [Benzoatithermus flavus]|uniref:DUF4157 domain-containing protein n=1 Tax=Benzoatithermus flavus TaxID=3108223 RepID=A0ABU8XU96_9PROT
MPNHLLLHLAVLGVGLALGLHGTGHAARAETCGSLEPVALEIQVRAETPEAPRIVAASETEIRRRAFGAGLHDDRPDRRTTGLTATQVEGQAGYRLARAALPGRQICLALRSIEARIANSEVVVYVDRRYAEGSCERAAILDHELAHVRINREALQRGRKSLRARLESAVEPWRGRWVRESELGTIDAAIGNAVAEGLKAVRADAARLHAQLDTPESYARTQRRCAGW